MKTTIMAFAVVMAQITAWQIGHAQGTTYVSNLGSTTAGNLPIGSDAWLAGWFETGSSAEAFVLNSIQLSMSGPSGAPGGFSVMLWDFQHDQSFLTLAGSDPFSPGVFSYGASDFELKPSTVYWFAVTSATQIGTGAFRLNYSAPVGYVLGTDGWLIGGAYQSSSDGVHWSRNNLVGTLQFAVDATPIPEPSILFLLVLGVPFLPRIWLANGVRQNESSRFCEHMPAHFTLAGYDPNQVESSSLSPNGSVSYMCAADFVGLDSDNGLTKLLTTTNKTICAGSTHHVKIAIADAMDQILDPEVFIKASTPCP